jgi:hypothetical protein
MVSKKKIVVFGENGTLVVQLIKEPLCYVSCPGVRASEDSSCLRTLGYRNRTSAYMFKNIALQSR